MRSAKPQGPATAVVGTVVVVVVVVVGAVVVVTGGVTSPTGAWKRIAAPLALSAAT